MIILRCLQNCWWANDSSNDVKLPTFAPCASQITAVVCCVQGVFKVDAEAIALVQIHLNSSYNIRNFRAPVTMRFRILPVESKRSQYIYDITTYWSIGKQAQIHTSTPTSWHETTLHLWFNFSLTLVRYQKFYITVHYRRRYVTRGTWRSWRTINPWKSLY